MNKELIDSNIFLRVCLEERGADKCLEILDKNGRSYIGFVTTIQLAHVLRRINDKIKFVKNSRTRDGLRKNQKIAHLKTNRDWFIEKIMDFNILDFSEQDNKFLNELNKPEHALRMEFHDKMNVAVAISNKLNIQAVDKDLIEDFSTIEEISKEFGHKIRLNQEL